MIKDFFKLLQAVARLVLLVTGLGLIAASVFFTKDNVLLILGFVMVIEAGAEINHRKVLETLKRIEGKLDGHRNS